MDESISLFSKLLGVECYIIEEVKDQFVKTAFFKVGQSKIELLKSTNPDSMIYVFFEKQSEEIHHIAFATENADKALTDAKENFF